MIVFFAPKTAKSLDKGADINKFVLCLKSAPQPTNHAGAINNVLH